MYDKDFDPTIDQIKKNANQSYIMVVNNNEIIEKFITVLKNKLEISTNDLLLLDSFGKKIKISQIRKICQKASLKPQGKINLICILDSENMTLEGGNSLLKILEEPPRHSLFILFTKNIQQLLPTIVSRCMQITLRDEKTNKIDSQHIQLLLDIMQSNYYQKFNTIHDIIESKIGIRQLLLDWLEYYRQKDTLYPNNIEFNKIIYSYLKKYSDSINQKLFLENLVLSLELNFNQTN